MSDEQGGAPVAQAGPLQGEALAQHKALLADTEFQAAMSGRGGHSAKQAALAKLEAISKGAPPAGQSFPQPSVTSEQLQADPRYQTDMAQGASPEARQNALRQAEEIQHQEILSGQTLSDADAAELDRAHQPVSPISYANSVPTDGAFDGDGKGAVLRGILFDAGVSPHATAAIAAIADEVALGTEAQYFARIDATKDAVMRMAGGREIIGDAIAYMTALPDGPLALAAELAATVPQGIVEMARLHRAAARRQGV